MNAALSPESEKLIIDWIMAEYERGKKVPRARVQQTAKQLANRDSFMASWGWLRKFLIKYNLREMVAVGGSAKAFSQGEKYLKTEQEESSEEMGNIEENCFLE